MSANLVVDLFAATAHKVSFHTANAASGVHVGNPVDLLEANTYTNVFLAGGPNSGKAYLQIQTSDSTTSGTFTDPTSGIPTSALPRWIQSGSVFLANSGFLVSGVGPGTAPTSGQLVFGSGGIQGAAFLRPHRYARLIHLSGHFTAHVIAGFIGNLKTTGSGGGQTFSPGSGLTGSGVTVNGVFV